MIIMRVDRDVCYIDAQGRIIVFTTFVPWKEHLHQLEGEMQIQDGAKSFYALYPDTSKQWRIQAVPLEPSSFTSRKPLPEAWRGVRDENLSGMIGIAGCVFGALI